MFDINSDTLHEMAHPFFSGTIGVGASAVLWHIVMKSKGPGIKVVIGCLLLTYASIFLFKDLSPQMIFDLTGSKFLETVWGLPDTTRYGLVGILVVNLKRVIDMLPNINKLKGVSK